MNGREVVEGLEKLVRHYRAERQGINLTDEMREAAEKQSNYLGKLHYGEGDGAIFYAWYDNKMCRAVSGSEKEPINDSQVLEILNIPIERDIEKLVLRNELAPRLTRYAADYAVNLESGPVTRGYGFSSFHGDYFFVALIAGVGVGMITSPVVGGLVAGGIIGYGGVAPHINAKNRCKEGYRRNPENTLVRQTPIGMKLWREDLIKEIDSV